MVSWDSIINKDINEYYERGLKLYTDNISSLNTVTESEEIIQKVFAFKMEAMNTFNQIFALNQDTFNNSEYLSWYNNAKRNLDNEIAKYDIEVTSENDLKSSQMCMSLVQDNYSEVKLLDLF